MSLGGTYDMWKLASPPEYDQPTECPKCDAPWNGEEVCAECGWDPEDGYWRMIDQKIDEAREREWDK